MDFSIIIPAKNEEKNIVRCLDSLEGIDYPKEKFEVTLVDNGSIDATVLVAKARGVQVFIQPELTISGLRNYGARQSQGKVFVFLDADCTVTASWLIEAKRYLNDQSVACFGSPPIVPPDATWVQESWFQIRKKKSHIEETDWLESMNMFVPASIFWAVGSFDETLVTCEDYEFSQRLGRQGKIIADERIVAVHHGEAADLLQFFQKERWRATSNRERLFAGSFTLQELPSLLLPPFYCLLFLSLVIIFVLNGVLTSDWYCRIFLLALIICQLPFLLLAFMKLRGVRRFISVMRLCLLLNVYFLARGLSVLWPIR